MTQIHFTVATYKTNLKQVWISLKFLLKIVIPELTVE